MKLIIIMTVVLSFVCHHANSTHPYSITIVNAELRDDKVVFTIKTNAEDLLYFNKMDFDSLFRIPADRVRSAARSHAQTILSAFYILDEGKKRLSSAITATDLSSLDGSTSFDVMSLLKYQLYYTVEFPLHPGTAVLDFHQELGLAGVPAVSFLSISRNGNSIVQNIELTKDKPFTMLRDAVSIGAPDGNSFMVSYISLTDTRITHELTIPYELLTSFVSVPEQQGEKALEVIRTFIAESSSVEINNVNIKPEITALVFENSGVVKIEKTSMVHVRIEYSLTTLPNDVTISWENFNWNMRWFRSMIEAFGVKHEHNFSRFQKEFKLKREVKVKRE